MILSKILNSMNKLQRSKRTEKLLKTSQLLILEAARLVTIVDKRVTSKDSVL